MSKENDFEPVYLYLEIDFPENIEKHIDYDNNNKNNIYYENDKYDITNEDIIEVIYEL